MDKQQLKPCIQFSLPSGNSGVARAIAYNRLQQKLNHLIDLKIITEYAITIHRSHMNVWFLYEHDITAFYLYWEEKSSFEIPKTVYENISEDPYYGN